MALTPKKDLKQFYSIAEVSEILNLEALTRRPEKLYLFYYV